MACPFNLKEEKKMGYSGYLVKCGNFTIPLNKIKAETYKVTRTVIDLDSYRDANGLLHRTALDHVPHKIELETLPLQTNTEMADLLGSIRSNFTNAKERKLNVTFYVPETDSYETQEMYMPDIPFEIYYADDTTVKFQKTRIAFIGY